MRSEDYGWMAVGGVVLSYEVVALLKRWPLLSEAMDDYRLAHKILVPAGIVYVAGHLMRVWPQRLDPLHRLSTVFGR